MKLPISEDKAAGKKTYMEFSGDDTHVGNTQRHQQKVAEIPASLYYDLIKKLGEPHQNQKAWRRWLNDSENRFFRSSGGSV